MGALTDTKVRNARAAEKAYKLGDGEPLYLHVSTVGGRSWRMNYQFGRLENRLLRSGQAAIYRKLRRGPE